MHCKTLQPSLWGSPNGFLSHRCRSPYYVKGFCSCKPFSKLVISILRSAFKLMSARTSVRLVEGERDEGRDGLSVRSYFIPATDFSPLMIFEFHISYHLVQMAEACRHIFVFHFPHLKPFQDIPYVCPQNISIASKIKQASAFIVKSTGRRFLSGRDRTDLHAPLDIQRSTNIRDALNIVCLTRAILQGEAGQS